MRCKRFSSPRDWNQKMVHKSMKITLNSTMCFTQTWVWECSIIQWNSICYLRQVTGYFVSWSRQFQFRYFIQIVATYLFTHFVSIRRKFFVPIKLVRIWEMWKHLFSINHKNHILANKTIPGKCIIINNVIRNSNR